MKFAKTYVATMVLAAVSIAGHGAEIAFPLAGGDLSSAEAWGGQTPLSTDSVLITNSGVYTALSSDLAYAALAVKAKDVTFDFSQTPTRKVMFDASAERSLTVHTAKSTTMFKGGEWVMADSTGENCSFLCGIGVFKERVGNHAVYMDGCVWTNIFRAYVGNGEDKCSLTMLNNSRIYAEQCFVGNGSPKGNKLHIYGGSKMYLSHTDNPFYSDNGGYASDPDGQIVVAGEGSAIVAPSGVFQVGNTHSHISLTVSNKASVVVGKLVVGRMESATNSAVFVSDGASIVVKGSVAVTGVDSKMVVSNASITVESTDNTAFTVGKRGMEGQSFRLAGAESSMSLDAPRPDIFAEGAQKAEFSIVNNARYNSQTVRIAVNATNCAFKVGAGGEFSVNDGLGTMEFGPGSGAPTAVLSVSNRIEVYDRATVRVKQLRLSGESNSLVISNASVVYNGEDTTDCMYFVGYKGPKWATGLVSSNCLVVLRGKDAKIDATKVQLHIYPSCKLRIEIPEEGYEENHIPLELKTISTQDGDPGAIEIDCAKFVEKTGGKLTIAKLANRIGAGSSLEKMLVETQKTLPKGCSLLWDKNEIVLKSKRIIGSVMIVR